MSSFVLFGWMMTFLVISSESRNVPGNNAIDYKSTGSATNIAFVDENDGSGNYTFSFRTSNGIHREERGEVTDGILRIFGLYVYTGPDGIKNHVKYEADEKGFNPEVRRIKPRTGPQDDRIPGAALASLAG